MTLVNESPEAPNRTALVTGGGRGIGRAIAVAMAGDSRRVAVGDLDEANAVETASMITAAGGEAVGVRLDVTDGESVRAGTSRARAEFGPIEILVNNAGWDELKPFLETDESFWDRVIEINFKGCLRLTADALPSMIERGWGRMVNIGSDAARVGSSLESVYSGAKSGVIAFTKTIAREVARSGVTANVVCPGPTRTPLLAGMVSSSGGEKLVKSQERAVPMRRLANLRT